jgi:transcriptional regulator with XRE-family HTH domain
VRTIQTSPRGAVHIDRLGGAIRDARSMAHLSQTDLAHIIGCSQSDVSRWESGQYEPTLVELARIEHALGLDAGGLLHVIGYLDGGPTVRGALVADPALPPASRKMLVELYDHFLSVSRGARRPVVAGASRRSPRPSSPSA